VTVLVTAAYVTRLVVRTFFGSYRGSVDGTRAQVHESPLVMTGPLVLLAGFAIVLGLPVLPHSYGVTRWLDAPAGTRPLEVGVGGVLLTGAIAVAGAAVVVLLHRRRPAEDPIAVLGRASRPLAHAFWVDEIYDVTLVRPSRALTRSVLSVDRRGVDATVVGSGTATGLLGTALRRAQNGNVQAYASGLVVGVLAVVVAVSLAVAR
jgi:NADH-quinone oxidoreductase subunit L